MRATFPLLVLSVSLLVLALTAPPAHAQDAGPFPEPVYGGPISAPHHDGPVDRPRLGAHFSLGGGGKVKFDGTGFDEDADPSVGFGLRFLYPLLTYVAVGAQFEMLWVRPASSTQGRDPLMDILAVLEARYPFRVSDHDAEAYFEMPVGLSVLFPGDSAVDNGPGFALSLLGGARLWVTDRIGVYTDIGWGIHHTHNDVHGPFGAVGSTIEPILKQMIFHVGAHFAL